MQGKIVQVNRHARVILKKDYGAAYEYKVHFAAREPFPILV